MKIYFLPHAGKLSSVPPSNVVVSTESLTVIYTLKSFFTQFSLLFVAYFFAG
jgi:hypothetical protein